MPFAAPLALLFLAATLLVVGGCTAFLATCLRPLQNVLDTMPALWHINCDIMLLFVQYGAGLNIRNRNFGKSLSFLNIDSNFKKFSAQAILPRESQMIS